MFRHILKHSLLYTVAAQVPALVNLVLLPIISPFLTPDDYRIYGLLLAYIGAIAAFSSLGFPVLLQNSFFRDRNNYKMQWVHYLGFLHLYRIVYGIVLGVIIYFVFRDDVGERIWLVLSLTVIPLVFFDVTKIVGMRLCQYTNRHKLIYTSTAISGLLTAAITFTAVYVFRIGYIGWLIAAFTGGLIQFIYFAYLLYVKEKVIPVWKFDRALIKNGLRVAVPTIPHAYSSYLLNTSDRLLLDWNNTQKYFIGQYNLAYGFASYFENFNSQVNTVVSPIYFELFAKNDKRANQIVRGITFLWLSAILIVAFLVSIWAREIFAFLYRNDDLNTAYPFAIFILMSFAYRPLYVASVDRAIFHEKSLSLLKISAGAGLINLVLNIITIPFFGVWAASINTFISFMYMGVAGHLLKSTRHFPGVPYRSGIVLLVIISMTITAFVLRDIPVWQKIAVSACVLTSAWVLYVLKGKEIIGEVNSIRKK